MGSSWSWRLPLTLLRPLWGDEGAGVLWLALGVGTTFVLGLALQLLGLRTLGNGGYATFVFALGVGNIANAVAGAIQPVVAARAATERPAFLPVSWRVLAIGGLLGTVAAAAALSPGVGPVIALLVVAQVPLHATVAVGLGRLQAQRRFMQMAACLALWSVARFVVAVMAVVVVHGGAGAFVAALPFALLVEAIVLWLIGAYRCCETRPAADGTSLLVGYGLWALFAWLLNADAVYAPRVLAPSDADAYATAFTLGRQPIYAVAPLTMVLLPVALHPERGEQRSRLFAIFGVTIALLIGTTLLFGARPELVLRLLTGDPASTSPLLLRGYAIIGPVAAGATLLMTFTFALGCPPRPWTMLALALGFLAITIGFVSHSLHLLVVQGLSIAAVTTICALNAMREAFRDSTLQTRTVRCGTRAELTEIDKEVHAINPLHPAESA